MVLKAKRNYKEELKKANDKKAEAKAIADFTKDMQNAKEKKSNADMVKEFGPFLTKALERKENEFFRSMKNKLDEGVILSENMVAAIRKCMDREKQWAKEREEKKDLPPREITLKVKPFLMKALGIDSRVITGVVKAESAKAWLIEGKADMVENMSWCVRCGRELTEPASQTTGMGQTCAGKAGIPYDPQEVLGASKRKRTAIRNSFKKKLNAQTFESWIPKSQAEVFEG